jgi:hypothetical protein
LQTQLDEATQEIAELKAKRAQVNDATENKQPPDQKE